jgi:NAD+ kinase
MPPAAGKPSFRRVALVGKLRSAEIKSTLQELAVLLAKRGCEVVPENAAAAYLAVVVGGDGSLLAAARELVGRRVPVVGINLGRVGFMSDIGRNDMQASVGAILDGNYAIEERALLDAEIFRGKKSILRTIALNEAVVGKGSQGRLIEFSLTIDGEFVYTLRGDGVIVATPASAAYALSAQGRSASAVPAGAGASARTRFPRARSASATAAWSKSRWCVRWMHARISTASR